MRNTMTRWMVASGVIESRDVRALEEIKGHRARLELEFISIKLQTLHRTTIATTDHPP